MNWIHAAASRFRLVAGMNVVAGQQLAADLPRVRLQDLAGRFLVPVLQGDVTAEARARHAHGGLVKVVVGPVRRPVVSVSGVGGDLGRWPPTAGPRCRAGCAAAGCSARRRGRAGRAPAAACPSRSLVGRLRGLVVRSATRRYGGAEAGIRDGWLMSCLSLRSLREARRDREGGVGQGDKRERDRGPRLRPPGAAESQDHGRGIGRVDEDRLRERAPQRVPGERRKVDAKQRRSGSRTSAGRRPRRRRRPATRRSAR